MLREESNVVWQVLPFTIFAAFLLYKTLAAERFGRNRNVCQPYPWLLDKFIVGECACDIFKADSAHQRFQLQLCFSRLHFNFSAQYWAFFGVVKEIIFQILEVFAALYRSGLDVERAVGNQTEIQFTFGAFEPDRVKFT